MVIKMIDFGFGRMPDIDETRIIFFHMKMNTT